MRDQLRLCEQAIGRAVADMWILVAVVVVSGSLNVTVTQRANTANGGFNIRVSPGLSSCVSQSGYGPWLRVHLSVSSRHQPDEGGHLLVAFLTGTAMSLYFNDSSCRSSR